MLNSLTTGLFFMLFVISEFFQNHFFFQKKSFNNPIKMSNTRPNILSGLIWV